MHLFPNSNKLTTCLSNKLSYSLPLITELPQAIAAATDSKQVPSCIVQSLNDVAVVLHWSDLIPKVVIMDTAAVPTTAI